MSASPSHIFSEYETIYILSPDASAEDVKKIQTRVSDLFGKKSDSFSGSLIKVEGWGRRRLAYPIARHTRGVYLYLHFLAQGGFVQELERVLQLQDLVLRYQSILLKKSVDPDTLSFHPEELHNLDLSFLDEPVEGPPVSYSPPSTSPVLAHE